MLQNRPTTLPLPLLYTSAVSRVSTGLLLPLVLGTAALAQVRILVPKQQYKPQEQVQAKLENSGTSAVTICIGVGQWSPNQPS